MNKVFLFMVLGLYASVAQALPPSFNFSGTLMDVSGTSPLLDSAIVMRFDILDPNKACVLYEETQTINTTATNGAFSVMVGSAQGSAQRTGTDPGLSLAAIFQNSLSPTACYAAPVISDGRYLRVSITPSSGTQETLTPDFYIGSVPMAMTAQTLEGNSTIQGSVTLANSGQLLFTTSGGSTGFRAPSSLTSAYTLTLPTSAGSAGQILTTDGSGNLSWSSMPPIPTSLANGSIVGNVTGTTGAPASVTLTQLMDTDLGMTAGSIAYRNGSNWTILPPGSAGTLLTSTGSTVGWQALTLPASGVTAGTYAKVTVNSSGIVTSSSALTASDVPFAASTSGNASGTVVKVGTTDANSLQLITNGTQRVTITSAGNIGIGTGTLATAPTNPLTVASSGTGATAWFDNSGTGVAAVYGNATGGGAGVYGSATTGGAGVYGTASGGGAGGYFTATGSSPALVANGHIAASAASAATLGSCTGGTLSGNDVRGTVSFSSTSATSCAINFAAIYASAPTCVVSFTGTSGGWSTSTIYVNSVSTSQLLVGFTSSLSAGTGFSYICLQ